MALAFECEDRQKIVDRILYISAFIRRFAIGDPPQAQQRHHMVDAQRAAIRHIGAQQLDKRLVSARLHHVRIHRWQAPVLAERPQNIRRRANRCFQTVQLAVAPGFRAAFRHTDRQIAIQPDRHVVRLTGLPAAGKLLIREPLQPEVEIDLISAVFTKRLHFRAAGVLIRFRPGGPAPAHRIFLRLPGVDGVERRLPVEAFARARHEIAKRHHIVIIRAARGEARPGHFQRGELEHGHGRVIDPLRLAGRFQRLLGGFKLPPRLRLIATPEILHRVHVDIDNVKPAAGRRAVRACALRVRRIERVDRV
ncbi:hypothetical protein BN128_2938 [Cronobacter sakazakii 696]|nr:hypothetical protein BN128_2938 [Cronobacter sakazakii 696]